MNWKTWIPFVLALALGLLAAKVGRDVILRSGKTAGPSLKMEKVVILKTDLDPGHVIEEADIVLGDYPALNLPRTSFMKTQDVAGRVLMQGAVKGQLVLESMLAPIGAAGGPQALVPAGMRAISVEVNEVSGVAGLLAPGCYVDVVTTFPNDRNAIARTIVQNVRVMAVGQNVVMQQKKDSNEALALARSVTLIVTPRDAEAIELSASAGRTRLVLRGAMDRTPSDPSGVTVAELLGPHANPTVPVETTFPQTRPSDAVVSRPPEKEKRYREVQVWNGSEVTTVKYEIKEAAPSAVTNTSDLRKEVEQP
jgi:pilus assembly protein CpaB